MEISMPPSHVALSGDLHVQIAFTSFTPLLLQLSRLEGNLAQPLTTFPVFFNASALSHNSTIVKIPCGFFSRGGQYYVLVKKKPLGTLKNEHCLYQFLEIIFLPQVQVTLPFSTTKTLRSSRGVWTFGGRCLSWPWPRSTSRRIRKVPSRLS